MTEIESLQKELKQWKSTEVRGRFDAVGSMLPDVQIAEIKLKIKRLKRGEDI